MRRHPTANGGTMTFAEEKQWNHVDPTVYPSPAGQTNRGGVRFWERNSDIHLSIARRCRRRTLLIHAGRSFFYGAADDTALLNGAMPLWSL
jgi:hypothetical protein